MRCAKVAWGRYFSATRASVALSISARRLTPPMVVAGHDAGRNVANGSREVHLIVYSIPTHARFVHATPLTARASTPWVQQSLYQPLGLDDPRPADYPAAAFVGAPSARSFDSGNFLVAYDPTSAHRGIEILAHGRPTAEPDEICRELDELFRKFPDVRHVTVSVLADKVDLLRSLCSYGFDIVAYLPAWCQGGGGRYDCVQLAKCAYAERPLVQGFDDVLARLVTGLASVLTPSPERRDKSCVFPASRGGR
jgi:hypothetical protein